MRLGVNIMALQAHRNLLLHQRAAATALRRLSSGKRIQSAADDAAGLGISQRMQAQIRGLRMASRNAQNTISLLQTAEGGLNETYAILQRMRELATQSANGTYQDAVDRENLDQEYQALMDEIDRIAGATHYNGIRLLDGSAGGKAGEAGLKKLGLEATAWSMVGDWWGQAKLNIHRQEDGSAMLVLQAEGETVSHRLTGDGVAAFRLSDGRELTLSGLELSKLQDGVLSQVSLNGSRADVSKAIAADESARLVFQIGANASAAEQLAIDFPDASTAGLGSQIPGGLLRETHIRDQDSAARAIETIVAATNQVSGMRGSLGAQTNRLEYTIRNLDNQAENLTDAENRITGADMAEEMMNYIKATILMQAAQAMMAQAMLLPRSILALLGAA